MKKQNKNEAVADSKVIVVLCSSNSPRAYRWSEKLAGVIRGQCSDLDNAKDEEAAIRPEDRIDSKPLVLFTRDPNSISVEIAARALKVVLVEPPAEFVSREFINGFAFTAEKQNQWIFETRRALNFFQRNRGSAVALFTFEDIEQRAEDCLSILNGLELGLEKFPVIEDSHIDPVFRLLANLLVERQAQCRNLYEEVLAASSIARKDEEICIDIETNIDAVAKHMREQPSVRAKNRNLEAQVLEQQDALEFAHLRINQMQEELEAANHQSVSNHAELEQARLQVHQLQEELEASYLRSVSNDEEVRLQQSQSTDSGEGENDLKPELDLALLQIHQLQEELEIYYQRYLEASGRPVELLGQIGNTIGGDTLRVLRLVRGAQHSSNLA